MKCLTAILILLLVTVPSRAWNATGHKAIALIAYNQLAPATRARVDQILSKHPDYPKWIAGAAASDRGRAAVLAASVWPDTIRNDPRFHDDSRTPTSNIPGLPPGSQARHGGWHYTNLPFSPDGTKNQTPAEVNIVTKLREFEALGSMTDLEKTYILPWLLHLIGDIHQPLHTTARFDRLRPNGDRGGNAITMKSGNLHSYWDSRIGTSETDRFLNQLVATIQGRHPKPGTIGMNPDQWAREGFELRVHVYGFTGDGTEKSPALMSDSYSVKARETAYSRAALAGYRLAEFLNQRLR
jgi:hypothetical protein